MSTAAAGSTEIVRAREEHLEEIPALAESWRLDTTDPGRAGRDGFLGSRYTIEDYRTRLTTAEHFWVAESAGNEWLKQSPTGLVMVLLPALVAASWAAMLIVTILH
ncbi:hypothetical protein ABZ876_38375 [Streptomyces sp. NPDC046931]|uniref:hypothetical protein n=1 Tax=Streptomyces sp. NPDC046931 TaxID=3154806 RepID=UPI00340F1A45